MHHVTCRAIRFGRRGCLQAWGLGFLGAWLGIAGCGSSNPTDPFTSYQDDPNVYYRRVDLEKVISQDEGGHLTRFPVDQLVLLAAEGATRALVQSAVAEEGGEIVGQAPDLGFYQLQLETTSLSALDDARDRIEQNPAIALATYNLLTTPLLCPANNDNANLSEEDACFLRELGYFEALGIVEELRPHISFHPVTVAVIDTGVQADNGQFDDVALLNLDQPGTPLTDSAAEGHGTQVAGMLAADDDGAGVNGIASRFIGSGLRLAMGSGNSTAAAIVNTRRAVRAGATVVNYSFEIHVRGVSSAEARRRRGLFERVMRELEQTVLFVVAAPNEHIHISALFNNAAPAGIHLPNVLTVGGTAHCRPLEAVYDSGYGPLVPIAACAENVPAVALDGSLQRVHGNSVSAPQVAALAAILQSIEPGFSPAQLKRDFILRFGIAATASEFGGRLFLPRAIDQLLVETSTSEEVLDALDADRSGTHDGVVAPQVRLCGGWFALRIASIGSWSYASYLQPSEDDPRIISDGSVEHIRVWGPSQAGPDDPYLLLFVYETHPIELNVDYLLESVTFSYHTGEPDALIGVGEHCGTLVHESCAILDRDRRTLVPIAVVFRSRFEAEVEVATVPGGTYVDRVEGEFELPFLYAASTLDDEFVSVLEENCEGGLADDGRGGNGS